MKSKMLAVLALVVFGCAFASAQSFGFASTGGGLYCNYEQLYVGGGIVAGWDNLSVCGYPNATIIGFVDIIPASDGLPVHGLGVTYGDGIYALEGDPNMVYVVHSALKCNAQNPKTGKFKGAYGWMGLAGFSGVLLGGNYGYLSCTLPSKEDGDVLMRGTTFGKLARQK